MLGDVIQRAIVCLVTPFLYGKTTGLPTPCQALGLRVCVPGCLPNNRLIYRIKSNTSFPNQVDKRYNM